MGIVLSQLCQDEDSTTGENDLVKKFHSSSEWNTFYASSKQNAKLMVIDFSAAWCPPCKLMEPYIQKLAAKYADVTFIKIDVDELPDVAEEFDVEAMPTFVLIRNGAILETIVGALEEELNNEIKKHLKV